jgi:hypothetical protein
VAVGGSRMGVGEGDNVLVAGWLGRVSVGAKAGGVVAVGIHVGVVVTVGVGVNVAMESSGVKVGRSVGRGVGVAGSP